MSLFEPIFGALDRAKARYVIVGGVATVLHGYARLTADVDIIIDFDPAEADRTLRALAGLGLRPRAPVAITDLADASKRESWIRDKGMTVFSLWDPKDPMREVDVFVAHPIPFEELYRDSEVVLLGEHSVRIASIPHLIRLKRLANRPEDRVDIEALTTIMEARSRDE
jgi:hypothetical protein